MSSETKEKFTNQDKYLVILSSTEEEMGAEADPMVETADWLRNTFFNKMEQVNTTLEAVQEKIKRDNQYAFDQLTEKISHFEVDNQKMFNILKELQ